MLYSVYIISKSGGLIFNHDCSSATPEVEKTLGFPLDIKLAYSNQRITVVFGQRDQIKVGYALLAINGEPVTGRKLGDKDVLDEILSDETNYPINIKFGPPKVSTNEKIVLASMFHSMYAIAALQIHRPTKTSTKDSKSKGHGGSSSGILHLETDSFRLDCLQTQTGVKFLLLGDLSSGSSSISSQQSSTASPTGRELILKRIYDIYSDYALKNPFYSIDMPIRCELFDEKLQQLLEQVEGM